MKKSVFLVLISGVLFAISAGAQENVSGAVSSTDVRQTMEDIDHFTSKSSLRPYDQMLTLQVGPYTPRSIAFTNWNNNTFDYSDQNRNTFLGELGWGISLFDTGPVTYYLTENLAYSNVSVRLPSELLSNPGNNTKVTVHFLGFDTRLQVAWEDSPVTALIPFVDAGVQYTLYYQAGSSDLVAGEGSATNFAAGVGLRYWVNRSKSLRSDFPGRYVAIPLFLTAKLNRIFPSNAGVDPGDTSVLGGITVGL